MIDDIFNYTLPDFKGGSSSPGRQRTYRIVSNEFKAEEQLYLRQYCEYFMRVIKAGFGQNKEICATIFQELTDDYLPVRLVAIYLNKSIHNGIKVETINSQDLLDRLHQLRDLRINKLPSRDLRFDHVPFGRTQFAPTLWTKSVTVGAQGTYALRSIRFADHPK